MPRSSVTNDSGKKPRTKFFAIFILIILLVVVTLAKFYVDKERGPVAKESPVKKTITIPNGSGTEKIAGILKENDLIRNERIFKIYSKVQKRGPEYKSGIYQLDTAMNQEKIMDELVKGGEGKPAVTFTIPEGFELKQIADTLEKANLVDKEKFMSLTSDTANFDKDYSFLEKLPEGSTLEGYLYPSTYEVFEDATEKDIIKKMLNTFKEKYTDDIKEKGKKLGMNTHEIVTLASIIEREAVVEKERPIMSGVFHNRLEVTMPLQSCATVQYALGERKPVLSNKDVTIDSEYNTYVNAGLPPAPISSPRIESIIAAVEPADVDYLFFVRTGDDGSHTFSKSFNEHLDAKNRE